jgi:site-specific DNA recombinase
MKTVGYIRVSTDKQAERGISLEAQAEKIRAMALVQGRPGMAKLLAMVEGGTIKAVIVAKLDRLTRSVKDLCELLERFEKRGVALVSVAESLDTGSAAGRLVLNIMAAVSQWEREAIGERTRDAMRHKRNQGERVGNIAFGCRLAGDGQHLEQDPAEQAALSEIRRLRGEGTTLRGIAAALNHREFRTRRGTAWRLESVARRARILKQREATCTHSV